MLMCRSGEDNKSSDPARSSCAAALDRARGLSGARRRPYHPARRNSSTSSSGRCRRMGLSFAGLYPGRARLRQSPEKLAKDILMRSSVKEEQRGVEIPSRSVSWACGLPQ